LRHGERIKGGLSALCGFMGREPRPLAWAGMTARLRRCTRRSLSGASRATFPDLRCHTWGSLIS
jgi:hypothetical protein